jgi:hypothetical protein
MSPDQRRDDDPPVPGWDAVVAHNKRFGKVAERYPRRVAEAYGGDFDRPAPEAARHDRSLPRCAQESFV